MVSFGNQLFADGLIHSPVSLSIIYQILHYMLDIYIYIDNFPLLFRSWMSKQTDWRSKGSMLVPLCVLWVTISRWRLYVFSAKDQGDIEADLRCRFEWLVFALGHLEKKKQHVKNQKNNIEALSKVGHMMWEFIRIIGFYLESFFSRLDKFALMSKSGRPDPTVQGQLDELIRFSLQVCWR